MKCSICGCGLFTATYCQDQIKYCNFVHASRSIINIFIYTLYCKLHLFFFNLNSAKWGSKRKYFINKTKQKTCHMQVFWQLFIWGWIYTVWRYTAHIMINALFTDCLSSSSCLRSQSARERTIVSWGSVGREESSSRLGEGRAEERGVRGVTVSSSIRRSCFNMNIDEF